MERIARLCDQVNALRQLGIEVILSAQAQGLGMGKLKLRSDQRT